MRILCPWCGERSDAEFRSAGEAAQRPTDPAALDDRQWAQYLYGRDNRPGNTRELWWHWAGCRQWLLLERETLSHRILSVGSAAVQPRESEQSTNGVPPRAPQGNGDS